jgi:hypothetical protein
VVVLEIARRLLRESEHAKAVPLLLRVLQDTHSTARERLDACNELEPLGELDACREEVLDVACNRSEVHARAAVDLLIRHEWTDELVEVCRRGAPGTNVAEKAAIGLIGLIPEERINELARDDETEGRARLILIRRWPGAPALKVDLYQTLAASTKAPGIARSIAAARLAQMGQEQIAAALFASIVSCHPEALRPGAMELTSGRTRRRLLRCTVAQQSASPSARLAILRALAHDNDENARQTVFAMAFDEALDSETRTTAATSIALWGYVPEAADVLASLLRAKSQPNDDTGTRHPVYEFCRYAGRHEVVRAAYEFDLAPEVRLEAALEMGRRGYGAAVADAFIELTARTDCPPSVRLNAAVAVGRSLGAPAFRRLLTSIIRSPDAPEGVREVAAARLSRLT